MNEIVGDFALNGERKNPLLGEQVERPDERLLQKEIIMDTAKKDLLDTLHQKYSTVERVKMFGKIMDDYGVDVIFSLIPALWDVGVSLISSLYLLYEGRKIGLPLKDTLKVLWYQGADILVGIIPALGDVADYFFKANKWSAQIFEKHFEKLKKEALKKGVSQSEIDEVMVNQKTFVKQMNVAYDGFHQFSPPKNNKRIFNDFLGSMKSAA